MYGTEADQLLFIYSGGFWPLYTGTKLGFLCLCCKVCINAGNAKGKSCDANSSQYAEAEAAHISVPVKSSDMQETADHQDISTPQGNSQFDCKKITARGSGVAVLLPQAEHSSSHEMPDTPHMVSSEAPSAEASLQLNSTASTMEIGQLVATPVTRVERGKMTSRGSGGMGGSSPQGKWPTPRPGSAADASAAFACNNSLPAAHAPSPQKLVSHASFSMESAARVSEEESVAAIGDAQDVLDRTAVEDSGNCEPGLQRPGSRAGRGAMLKERLTDARQAYALTRKHSGN